MKVIFLMLATSLLWCGYALAQDAGPAITNKTIEHFDSRGEPGIQVVLRFGVENKIPLGLVLADGSLCTAPIDFTADNETVSKAMEGLTSRLPGYEWMVEDETVILRPRAVPPNTSTLLDMTIPRFAAPLGPLKEQRLYLWMDVRAILRPNEGTLLNYLSSDAEVKFPPIQLANVRVEEILNRLVSRPPYAGWVLHPVSTDLKETAGNAEFVTLIPYSEALPKIPHIACLSSATPAR